MKYIDWKLSKDEAALLEGTKLVLCDIWRKGSPKSNKTDEYTLLYEEDGKSVEENIKTAKFAKNIFQELTEKHGYERKQAIKFISEATMRAGDDMRTTRLFRYGIINSHVLRMDAILEEHEMPKPRIQQQQSLKQIFKEAWRDVLK